MRCEVIAVGTELLLGQIVDTNSSWMGEQLALAGIDSHFQTKVGDNHERMVSALRLALGRADAVILCGGLGPTRDDITRDAIAAVMGVDLVRDESVAEHLRAYFKSRGREMPLSNLRQADVPAGATRIAQMPGTAPGLVCPVGDQVVYAVPGVPYEMRIMLEGTVIPDLKRRAGVSSVIASRTLRTWGTSEARLGELVADRLDALEGTGRATIAFLASGIEGLKVRVTAKAEDEEAVARVLDEEEGHLRGILGDLVFGTDDETMEKVVIGMLAERGLSLAVAESVTGGWWQCGSPRCPGRARCFAAAWSRMRARSSTRSSTCRAGRWCRSTRRARWPRGPRGASGRTSGSRPPASPGPTGRRGMRRGRSSSVSSVKAGARPTRCACRAIASACASTRSSRSSTFCG